MPEETQTDALVAETPVETPAADQSKFEFNNCVIEKILNGYVARVNANSQITAFYTKEELMAWLDGVIV